MSYKIEVTDLFEKQLKMLVKKYPSLKIDYSTLITSLETTPIQGTSLGNGCYKIRVSIASKGKVNLVAQELLHTYKLLKKKYTFYQCMISLSKIA